MSNQHMVVSLKYPKQDDGFPHPEHEQKPEKPQVRSGRPAGRFVPALIALVVVAAGAYFGYSWWQNQPHTTASTAPAGTETTAQDVQAAQKAQDIIARVARHIELPTDETPTVASVTDPDKLRDQPFFAHAKVGDQVLLYTQAKKAYLYDPKADKLVEVAPITTTAQ